MLTYLRPLARTSPQQRLAHFVRFILEHHTHARPIPSAHPGSLGAGGVGVQATRRAVEGHRGADEQEKRNALTLGDFSDLQPCTKTGARETGSHALRLGFTWSR